MVGRFLRRVVGGLAVSAALVLFGCGGTAGGGPGPIERPCSQLHRGIARWQGVEREQCGNDLTALSELMSFHDGRLLFYRRFAGRNVVWRMDSEGRFDAVGIEVIHIDHSEPDGFTFAAEVSKYVYLPAVPEEERPPLVLIYEPRADGWTLYGIRDPSLLTSQGRNPSMFDSRRNDRRWPDQPGLWKGPRPYPWDRQFLGLEDGYLLDWNPADGSYRFWRLVPGEATGFDLVLTALAGGPREELRRGHRLVHLGRGWLLEWTPCTPRDEQLGVPCTGASYHLWNYQLGADTVPRDPLEAGPSRQGTWPHITANHEIVVGDPGHLVVWSKLAGERAGELSSYPFTPETADQALLGAPTHTIADDNLRNERWQPPTAANGVRKLVVIVQDGRSFDSYFGNYCTGRGAPGCTEGPDCCEPIPSDIPGTSSCALLDPEAETGHTPNASPACLRAKINGGLMDGFATPAPNVGTCGNPLDVACAGAYDQAGAVGAYHAFATRGALADRYFQTYAYVDGEPTDERSVFHWNLFYLATARFTPPMLNELTDRPLLTKELVRNQVDWVLYLGSQLRGLFGGLGIPIFYDPTWSPYRSIAEELEYDLARGQLPAVSIIVPEPSDKLRSESATGHLGNGVRYVERIVRAIEASPHADETLILVTHLTAGGFYDHVPPPPAPPLEIDGTSDLADAKQIHYGPRVPFLALGKFARPGHVSHVPLEVSSIVRFIEWNWLSDQGLKASRERHDPRRYRDVDARNLGSLLDPSLGIPE